MSKSGQVIIFWIFWFIIGFVSSYDSFLTVKYQNQMIYSEENPVCRWIMKQDDWDVSRFIGIKMAGTITALGILFWLHQRFERIAILSATSVVSFQICLLLYLTFV